MKQSYRRLPPHLKPETRKWIYRLQREWTLEERHVRLLILAGEAWDRGQQAREILDEEGITVEDRFQQKKPHPCVAIERDSRISFARLLRETGLDIETEPPRPPR